MAPPRTQWYTAPKGLTTAEKVLLVRAMVDSPLLFLQRVLGCQVYDRQVEMLDLVCDHSRVAVVGANTTGKDFVAGRLLLWWVATHSPSVALVIGPTHRQVNFVVWREARSAYHSSLLPVGGTMYQTPRWELDDEQYALGFATSDPYNLQGFHSPHLFVLLTEAHNISQEHMEAVYRLNPEKILMTGNPLASSGEFYDAFHGASHRWRTLSLSALDAIRGQERLGVSIPGLVTQADADERKAMWGEESALYVASVLGRFPDNLVDAVVPRSKLMDAVARVLEPAPDARATLSCDVARFGDDATVVYRRHGHQCRLVWEGYGRNTQEVAGQLKAMAETDPLVDSIIVDDVGVGGGVTDRLREEQPRKGQVRIVAFNGGAKAIREDMYVNAIAEAWLELARAFQDGIVDIDKLPEKHGKLVGQLSSRRKIIQGDRRLKLEPKEDYKKRVGHSPDHADALAMCYSPLSVSRFNIRFLG